MERRPCNPAREPATTSTLSAAPHSSFSGPPPPIRPLSHRQLELILSKGRSLSTQSTAAAKSDFGNVRGRRHGFWGSGVAGGELTIALLDKGGQLIGLLLCHRSLQGSPFGCTCRLPASASPGRAPASFLPPSAALALCRSLRKAFGFVGGYALLSANLRSS